MSLSLKARNRARQLSNLLYECGDDIDYWVSRLKYVLVERELPDGINAILYDGMIVIHPGMPDTEKIVVISHEIYHHEYHGAAVAFRELRDSSIDRDECQAESFGVLVAEPSLFRYDSIEAFHSLSTLPPQLKKLREKLFYQIKY